jgi:ribosomal protein L12E/L44/L45/RPP1/RPP2
VGEDIKGKRASGRKSANAASENCGSAELEKLKSGEVINETLKAVVRAIFITSEQLIMSALDKAMKNKDIAAHLNDGIIRYLYAATLLSFVGKEINRENLTGVIKSLDVAPNNEFIDIVLSANLKGHLVYVYAYYYLLVNGAEVSEQKLIETVESLGIKADRRTAAEVIKFAQQ